jgi:PPP family 3-phenylpropionic acid transporter
MVQRYPTGAIPSKLSAPFYAAYFAVLGIVLPLLGPYLDGRGISAVGVGFITALFSLAKLVYAPALGARVDRGLWFPGLLSVHMAVSVLAALAVAHLSGPLQLGIALFAVGLGYGTVLPLVEAAVLERLPRRGYGALRLFGSLGFVAAAAVSAVVVRRTGMTGFPYLLAGSMAVLALTCVPFERTARPHHPPSRARVPTVVWWMLGLLTLHQVAHGPYYAFFSIYLRSAGYGGSAISALWSLGVVAELFAFLRGGRWENRLGRRRLLGLALLLSPLRWLLLALPPTTATLVAAQAGHAVTFALVHLSGIQVIQAAVPPGAVRRVQALYSGLTFGLGVVAGSALAGPLYGAVGGRGSFLAAALLSAMLFLAWLPVARRLPGDNPATGETRL